MDRISTLRSHIASKHADTVAKIGPVSSLEGCFSLPETVKLLMRATIHEHGP